jgi:hypothetical protein
MPSQNRYTGDEDTEGQGGKNRAIPDDEKVGPDAWSRNRATSSDDDTEGQGGKNRAIPDDDTEGQGGVMRRLSDDEDEQSGPDGFAQRR